MPDRGPNNEEPAQGPRHRGVNHRLRAETRMNYVGWDWASRSHDVTVVDAAGAVVDRWAFGHTEQGLIAALQRLRRHGQPADLPVIIERTSGLVIDRLLAAGHPVTPV